MAERELYFVEREFNCDIETLWNAWTNAKELEAWYSPTMLSVVPGSVTSEVFIGGRWAVAVDVQTMDFASRIQELDTAGTYVVYCRSGNRSGVAIEQMKTLGFTNLTKGGAVAEASALTGLPVVQ